MTSRNFTKDIFSEEIFWCIMPTQQHQLQNPNYFEFFDIFFWKHHKKGQKVLISYISKCIYYSRNRKTYFLLISSLKAFPDCWKKLKISMNFKPVNQCSTSISYILSSASSDDIADLTPTQKCLHDVKGVKTILIYLNFLNNSRSTNTWVLPNMHWEKIIWNSSY